MAICPVGRTSRDPEHRTCAGCIRRGLDGCRPKRRRVEPPTVHWLNGKVVCTRDLRTPNDWTNKQGGDRIYRSERRAWQKLIEPLSLLWGKPLGRRHLRVTRYVRDGRSLYRDETNREGSLKPLEDALVRLGVLIDDRDEYLSRDPLRQEIDAAWPRVEIEITD